MKAIIEPSYNPKIDRYTLRFAPNNVARKTISMNEADHIKNGTIVQSFMAKHAVFYRRSK